MKKQWIIGASLLLASLMAQALEIGDKAPDYRIPLEGGGEMTAHSQQDRVTLLHFWASWCVPCREEMPRLDTLYRRYHEQGLDIVAIDMDNPHDLPDARIMMEHHHFPWSVGSRADVGGFGRIWRLPMSVLIDRHGIVRQNALAADNDQGLSEAELERQVLPWLKGDHHGANPTEAKKNMTPLVLHAYARATAPGQSVGVVYLTLRNEGDSDDALEGADSPVADHIMLHQTMAMGDMSGMGSGMSHMQHEYHLVIPAHGQVELKPGGHHLMLEDLEKPLVAGQVIPLDLHFQHAGKVHLEVEVTPLVPQ